jgi:hypothetical protein
MGFTEKPLPFQRCRASNNGPYADKNTHLLRTLLVLKAYGLRQGLELLSSSH